MPKGHSTLEPLVNEAVSTIAQLLQRVSVLERQIAAMNDSFSRGNIPSPQYEQQFKVWPGANPASNNV